MLKEDILSSKLCPGNTALGECDLWEFDLELDLGVEGSSGLAIGLGYGISTALPEGVHFLPLSRV